MDDKEALTLANAFLNAGLQSEQFRFTIRGSTDEVVITITRTQDEKIRKGMKKLAERYDVSPYGSGAVCPACSGTGRL